MNEISADVLHDLQRDAARYRWLREEGVSIMGDEVAVRVPLRRGNGDHKAVKAQQFYFSETLDAAVDRGMKEPQDNPGE